MLLFFISTTALAIGVRILVNPVSNVFQKYLTQRQAHPLFVVTSTYGLLSIGCIFYLFLNPPIALPLSFWYNSIIFNILGVAGNYFLVKSLHQGDLSVLGPINAYKSLVSLVFGLFLLGEIPNGWGISGMLLIVAGSYFVLSQSSSSQRFSWQIFQQREVQYRFLALFLSAIDALFLKKIIVATNANLAFVSWCVGGFLFSFTAFLFTLQSTSFRAHYSVLKTYKWQFLALGFSAGLMQLSTNYAFEGIQVSYALALFQISALVSVLLGVQFFQETQLWRKLAGAAVMVIGAVLIILFR
ncbi:EamA family transporter [Runella sp.]|uniref:EamA family transporter n=1 Tax=Runella sp. TaxID=1960881 RepID=UPI003D0B5D68